MKPYITGGDINDRGRFPTPRFFVIFDEEVHKPTEEDIKCGIALEPNRLDRPFPLIKSTNYLFGLIPLSKAQNKNFESLYITPEGEITEAMSSNFFSSAKTAKLSLRRLAECSKESPEIS